MVFALDPKAQHPFVLKDDRELGSRDPYRTTWNLRVLTIKEQRHIKNSAATARGDESVDVNSGDIEYSTIRLGLEGVVNFRAAPTAEQLAYILKWRDDPSEDLDMSQVADEVVFTKDQDHGHKGGRRMVVPDEFLQKVPTRYRGQVADAIHEIGMVKEDEAEKS